MMGRSAKAGAAGAVDMAKFDIASQGKITPEGLES